jgi:hypothetical protein
LRFVFRGLFVILLLQIKKRVSPGNSGGGDSPSGVYPFFINQINYHNEKFIIVCVGSGGTGADGV